MVIPSGSEKLLSTAIMIEMKRIRSSCDQSQHQVFYSKTAKETSTPLQQQLITLHERIEYHFTLCFTCTCQSRCEPRNVALNKDQKGERDCRIEETCQLLVFLRRTGITLERYLSINYCLQWDAYSSMVGSSSDLRGEEKMVHFFNIQL